MKESRLYSICRPLIKIFTNFVLRPKYVGLENIPKNEKVILAGTHTSILDCLLLISSTKRNIHFLAKKELWHGAKKIIFANMGLIPVDRSKKDHNCIALAEGYLQNDMVIGIFPEGTTQKKRGLLPFKMGTVKMASDTNSFVVPFAIIGKYKIFHKGLTIIFDKPYKINKENLVLENEKLRNKVIKLIKKGEEYGNHK